MDALKQSLKKSMEILVYVTVPEAIFSLAQLFAIATKNFVTLPPAI